jgi:hypothetical protein
MSAAIPDGHAASKVHEPDPVLKILPGSKRKRSPTPGRMQSLPPLVPAGGGSGQEQPAKNGCLPGGSGGGATAPLSGRITGRDLRVSWSACTVTIIYWEGCYESSCSFHVCIVGLVTSTPGLMIKIIIIITIITAHFLNLGLGACECRSNIGWHALVCNPLACTRRISGGFDMCDGYGLHSTLVNAHTKHAAE